MKSAALAAHWLRGRETLPRYLILGMTNLEDVPPEDEPRAYRSKGYFSRVGVAFAGPAVHFAIALVLMFSIFYVAGDISHQRALTKLDSTTLGASDAGIRAGDTVVAIDGTRITNWDQVSGVIQHHKAGDQVEIVVVRDGEHLTKDVTLTQKVVDALEKQTDKMVLIKADQDVDYGTVMETMDALRAAGVEDMGLITEPKVRKTGGAN